MPKSEDLQRETQRVLAELSEGAKPLSARAAGTRLSIGYNQIADMLKGRIPAERTLIKFACAIGENPSNWLRYAGHNEFAKALDDREPETNPEDERAERQIVRELSGVPREMRSLLLRQIRAIIRAAKKDGSV